jgi:hypothetical protein
MPQGRSLAESLRVGLDLEVRELTMVRIGRHDVSTSTTPFPDAGPPADPTARGASTSQPAVLTFVDFKAPDELAEELAGALAAALLAEDGWWADFVVDDEHVAVFAGRVFRYRLGDRVGRDEAVEYGLAMGTPRHQLDWGE